jgi:23S rRNA (uracil1939-C5)-methyltransferase
VSEVLIERLAAGGDGIGRLEDGRTVFVPRTAPGDRVELAHVRLAARFARASVGRLVEAGADRVEPACPHYAGDRCGGCQLQHLSGDAQRAARARFVGDALRRIGKLDIADPVLVPAPDDWAYRTKITLHVAGAGQRIGYHRADRPDQVFALQHCLLAAPPLDRLWQAVRRHRELLPADFTTLALRLARDGTRHLIAGAGHDNSAWTSAARLYAALLAEGERAVLWWAPLGGVPRVMAGGDDQYPALAFQQVHPAMGDLVRARAVEALGPVDGRLVWDLYAGIGETTEALVAVGATVESVELDATAVRFALAHTSAPGRVTWHHGKVERVLPGLAPPAAAIVNPPRGGLGPEVTDELRRRGPTRLVYVSCDPATLARDLLALKSAYSVQAVTAYDLFPQTAHVETVTLLERP